MRRQLAIVVCLAFAGSVAQAAPRDRPRRGDDDDDRGRRWRYDRDEPDVDAVSDEDRDDDRYDRDDRDDDDRDEARYDRDDDDDDARDEDDARGDDDARDHDRGRRHRAARFEDDERDDRDDEDRDRRRHRAARHDDDDDRYDDDRYDRRHDDDDDPDLDGRDARVVRSLSSPRRARAWHVAFGPYLWASSVDANVSLGDQSLSTGVDFMEIQKHAKFGVPLLLEARYRRFAVYGDLQYGVIGLNGEREVGGFMVTMGGTATSWNVDGAAGYRVLGDPQSPLAVEGRVGLRYQRTAISGDVAIEGGNVAKPEYVDQGADGLLGARVTLRPLPRLALTGTGDYGVVGSSVRTWSATADATLRVTNHLLISAGWRTMTSESPSIQLVMHGPRAAVQLLF